ncbi:MAG: tetratricopeptide repeat protein [Polyangiaceae bacterium]|nr:tetratricopeptide repeat protein [Polyangiaceae bacterium]
MRATRRLGQQRSSALVLTALLSTAFLQCASGEGVKAPRRPAPIASASIPPPPPQAGADDSLRDGDDGLPRVKKAPAAPPAKPPPRVGLQGGLDALEASEYPTAEAELTKAAQNPAEKGRALVGLARLALATGRYADAIKQADEAQRADKAVKLGAALVKAKALAAQGKVEEAVRVCEDAKGAPEARRVRLFLGELKLRQGKRADAEPELMTLIRDFQSGAINDQDGEGLALAGRAAHLLRDKRSANDEGYNRAERAGNKSPELLLWRAELFLEAYNIGRAEESVREALKAAPDLAEAHVMMAKVKLEQTLDFDEAEREIGKALAVNRALPSAFFVRAGVLLRDLEIEEADKAIAEGLATDPSDLDLLSMRAAVRFLADDRAGFAAATRAVLAKNPEYARLYQIIAEYADWEHRYAEIVAMMRDAARLDPDDGRNFVTLGLNQIRTGDEGEGLKSLDRGFRLDRFNVRAFNTLNLYERDIAQKYDTVTQGPFRVRYPKDEKKVLERYVPGFLNEAWASMTRRYGFTPAQPVGVELYGSREHFSVRTSGLPNVGIQGVCFGATLAAISPKPEPFNWGNVLWHEVAHVFAIQLSKSHVPRWFTEGLSEYETFARRPEWQREEDPALYLALRRGRVPKLASMNRAFTHADDGNDMNTAYYASSQIVTYFVETFGMPKISMMLKAWGEGKRTPEVLRQATGLEPEELDRRFRAWLDKRLARYKTQFVPDLRPKDLAEAEKAAQAAPADARAQVDLALAALAAGDGDKAVEALERGRRANPRDPNVRFLSAKLALRRRDAAAAKKELEAMASEGNDGYAVRMMLADLADDAGDAKGAAAHYESAYRLDPTQPDPLQSLADLAKKANDADRELTYLRSLAAIDQHDRRVWRRLMARLLEKKAFAEAKRVGEGSLYVDVHGAETHALYAEALLGGAEPDKALFEAETALLGWRRKTPPRPAPPATRPSGKTRTTPRPRPSPCPDAASLLQREQL